MPYSKEKILKIRSLWNSNLRLSDIEKIVHCNRITIHRYCGDLPPRILKRRHYLKKYKKIQSDYERILAKNYSGTELETLIRNYRFAKKKGYLPTLQNIKL